MKEFQKFLQKLGAQFNPDTFPQIESFGSWEAEYQAAKQKTAVFDLSGLNVIRLQGKDHADFLHRMSMNEIRRLKPGQLVVNAFADAKGKIVDAVFMLKREDSIDLITGPGRGQPLTEWLDRFIFIEEITITDMTDHWVPLLLCGRLPEGLAGLEIEPMTMARTAIQGTEFEVCRVDHLLPRGLLMLVPAQRATECMTFLVEQTGENRVVPAGAQAFHALRIEQGIPMHGFEIDGDSNPYECGLKAFISYDKGCYVGQEVIARLDTYDKIKHEYTGLHIESDEIPPVPSNITTGHQEAGVLTSVTALPGEKGFVGIGRIRRKFLDGQVEFKLQWNHHTARVTLRAWQ